MGILARQFAVISAIFLPANLIAGILGMNVLIPSLADPDKNNPAPFAYVMIAMVGISILQLYFYRKMKWL